VTDIEPHLERGLAVEFTGGQPYPVVAGQLAALAASRQRYGQHADLSRVQAGWGNPYTAMAESVVAGLGLGSRSWMFAPPPGGANIQDPGGSAGGTAVDVAVIGYDGMDCGPWAHLGCRLTEVVAGRPTAFAISGQGTAGPFTALRIAATLVRTGAAGRALVLLLEHAQVPLDEDVEAPGHDRAVGFVVGPAGPLRVAAVEVVAVPGNGSVPAAPPSGLGLAGWVALAGSVAAGTPVSLTLAEPFHGYRGELRVAA
jgi:hypothetical protein